MAEPVVELFLVQFETLLAAIATPTFNTNVKLVDRQDPRPGNAKGTPSINVWTVRDRGQEEQQPDVPHQFQERVHEILLELFMKERSTPGSKINRFVADVIKQLKQNNTLAGTAIDTVVTGWRPALTAERTLKAAQVDVQIRYEHRLTDPFSAT